MASDHIPQELLLEILKRLPVKTICRFQSVCKSWSSLISSSYFSNTHRTFHSASTNEPKTYLSQDYNHCIFHREELNSSCLLAELEFPVQPHHRRHRIALSDVIHGVVFYTILALHSKSRKKNRWFRQSIMFWNPIIRRHVSAPLPPEEIKKSRHLLGAGYDARNNDLKAVLVPHFKKDGGSEVRRYYKVFSARTGRWKRREWTLGGGAAVVVTQEYGGCYFDGAVYWVTDRDEGNGHALVYFDCESEGFGRMELPEEIRDVNGNPRLIANGTGSLSLLVAESVIDIADMTFPCRLWTMKEYGVWTNDLAVRCSSSSKSLDVNTYIFHESMLLLNTGKPSVWVGKG